MRPNRHPNPFACLSHNDPGRRIPHGKDPLLWIDLFFTDVFFEPQSNLLGDEDDFLFLAAVRTPENELLILNVLSPEPQCFANAKSSPSHQFNKNPVSDLRSLEDDLINGLFLQDVPSGVPGRPEQLPQ